MQKLYTKTGDKGQSSLLSGERLSKASLVFEVLGTLDEFNASLGLVVQVYQNFIEEQKKKTLKDKVIEELIQRQKPFLLQLQRELFNLGAEIAGSKKILFQEQRIAEMEEEIDALQKILEKNWRQRFVLPGGSFLAAEIDLARTICRRTERVLNQLDSERDLRQESLRFINRSSDYLYVLRSFVNWVLKAEEIEY